MGEDYCGPEEISGLLHKFYPDRKEFLDYCRGCTGCDDKEESSCGAPIYIVPAFLGTDGVVDRVD